MYELDLVWERDADRIEWLVLPDFVVNNSGPNRLSALISGDRTQIGAYPPCPLQSFSTVKSHSQL
jgi:hypothetical protein